MSRIRRGLSFANVVSVIALFAALGGGAYAVAIAPTNSVVSTSIKNGQVQGPDVQNNGLTGRDIKESSLNGVLDCPAGTIRARDICYENTDHPADGQDEATVACAKLGLRLPTVGEGLLMVRDLPTPAQQKDYWTADKDKLGGLAAYRDTGGTPPFGYNQNDVNTDLLFRCVTSPRA